jgi:heptose I phosphotransferase
VTRREHIAADWTARLAAGGLRSLASILRTPPVEAGLAGRWELLSKAGLRGRQRWRWRMPDGSGECVLYLKRYEKPGIRAQLDRISRQNRRHSRAWWEFRQAQRLAEAQIGAPRPVGFAEEMNGSLERRSAVLLQHVPGEALDRAWLAMRAAAAPITRGPLRHDLTIRLARFVAAFHSTGLCHRDLYLCHIFAELGDDGRDPPRFAVIDLARALRPRVRRFRWLIKDLAQLDVSARQIGATRADRVRFLLAYLGLQPGAARARWYARRIVRKSDRILQRIARKSAAK